MKKLLSAKEKKQLKAYRKEMRECAIPTSTSLETYRQKMRKHGWEEKHI